MFDHPALAFAATQGPILPLYILEPEYWHLEDVSGRQFAFLTECIEDLRSQLAEFGLPLCVRMGEAVSILKHLCQHTGAATLVSHEETGNGWTYARDRRVAAWVRDAGLHWHELPQSGVIRRLDSRDGWAARRNRFVRQPQIDFPPVSAAPPMHSDPWQELLKDDCPQRQLGGRSSGLSLLGGFLTDRGLDYRRAMSSPVSGETACSRLSAHLALGTLSGREVAQATAARQKEIKGTRTGWGGSLKSYQARLAWRDHFMQKLEDEPSLELCSLHSAYRGLRSDDAERRRAWEIGETGVPFVDACMRYLAATGWLNFRMRSMVQAFASYHLWLDWRQTGLHLARQFTDYEPGIHWSQVQMQSGSTGMNTVRIYNPVKQGRDQDADGTFTRRWVPELAEVPDAYLQEPWRWDGASRLRYSSPIVDVTEAARSARQAIWAVRKGGSFRAEAARVVQKHASRKDSAGHFVNDREPRRAKGKKDHRQLGFEF